MPEGLPIGTKEIGCLMYVRLGLAVAKLPTFMKNARFNSNWEFKTPGQLKKWYNIIIGHIRTNQYGVYFAAHEVFGAHAAEYIAQKASLKRPNCLLPNSQQAEGSQSGVVDA